MKKVLGIVLLFTLLLSAGKIYASGNPAQNLSDWYKNSFQKESGKLAVATTAGMLVVFKEVNSFVKESKKSIEDALASFGDDKMKEAESGIEEYQSNALNSLSDTVAGLENVNFDDYVDKLNIEAEMDKDFENMVEELFSE
ncbi:hypothetical protein [Sporosarcina sp. E16_8]|uniref:hypothetical protein n=1 Tax=Sporosarcina sp. E16_8 TaxID=2789295 RepID=UPI001A90E944|nr:hypothetical protein [Sporosarcina sp. E16_8]MBO0588890.1 hypothetical protein [Sporosarcina sp. E16_8]